MQKTDNREDGTQKDRPPVQGSNRSNGGRFEQELSHILSENGFWCHVMQQNKAGQPADLIAVKGHYHTLIDCKVISDDKGFPFERMEENQKLAMRMFHRKTGEQGYFAMKLPDGSIWLAAMEKLEVLSNSGRKRMKESEIRLCTWSLEAWLKAAEKRSGQDKVYYCPECGTKMTGGDVTE